MIVKTLLDTDLYKFTTSYAYIKLFPYAMGTFSFNDRNETEYTEEFLEALKSEFNKLSRLRLTEEELEYMTRNCRFLPRVYWEWLSSFRFDPDKIDIHLDTTCFPFGTYSRSHPNGNLRRDSLPCFRHCLCI